MIWERVKIKALFVFFAKIIIFTYFSKHIIIKFFFIDVKVVIDEFIKSWRNWGFNRWEEKEKIWSENMINNIIAIISHLFMQEIRILQKISGQNVWPTRSSRLIHIFLCKKPECCRQIWSESVINKIIAFISHFFDARSLIVAGKSD